jgi:hypothetical protein
MFFPAASIPMAQTTSWLIQPQPALMTHHALKRAEHTLARQLHLVVHTSLNGLAPASAGNSAAQSNATNIHLLPAHHASARGRAQPAAAAPAYHQDVGMTPAGAPQDDVSGEMEQEADGDADADADGDGDGDGEELMYEEAEDDVPAELSVDADDPMNDNVDDDDADAQGDEIDEHDDALLDEMDPEEMTEEEQIRFLERQHEREQRARAASELSRTLGRVAAAQQQHQTPMVASGGQAPGIAPDGMHITPPTRSQRAAAASASSAAVMSAVARHSATAPSLTRSRSRHIPSSAEISPSSFFASPIGTPAAAPATASAPRTVRRALDMDSSSDSMQIDTPPRAQAAAASSVHGTPAAQANLNTSSNSFFATPTSSSSGTPARPGSSTTVSPQAGSSSMSAAMIAELGLSPEDAEALMQEELYVLEQARQQRLLHMRT